jgi:hypothetical protein
LQARGRNDDARKQWETVAAAGATTPPFIFADTCAALAEMLEARNPDRALTLYQRAAQTFGAAAETRATANRHATRLQQRLVR